MSKVTLTFVGHNAREISQRFYNWAVDGGLEDELIDVLSDEQTEVQGITFSDDETLEIEVSCLSND